MSAVLEEAPVTERTAHSGGATSATLDLALFEARRLLTRIPMLLAFAAYVAWIVWRTPKFEDGFPALQNADRATQSGPLLVGLAVMLCANHAVLRSQRHDTERHFGVLVLTPGRRTAAHVLSVVPAVLLVAVGVAGQFGWEALRPGAVGTGSVAELLVGPLLVLLFGAVGVLLARLIPSGFAVPMAIVLFFFLFFAGAVPTGTGERGTRWLAPVVGEMSSGAIPSDLMDRPAAWHALYLLGLGLTVGLLAVVAGGGRGWALKGAVAAALALAVTGGVAQTSGLPAKTVVARAAATNNPEKQQTCVNRDGSTYCSFPEWQPRTATWASVVRHVQSLAGGRAHTQPVLVRQRIYATDGLYSDGAIDPSANPYQVTVGTGWGGNRVPEFSAAVSSVLVAGSEKATGGMCDGRMVTAMWLALSWQPDPMRSLRDVRLDDSVTGSAIVLSPTDPLQMTAGQTDVVRELLAKPQQSVAAKVKAHWAELTAPKVTSARVAELLGVAAPKEADKCD
ncbi:ABC transporter permease [Streptomyces cylindrosporus]|uniref:ABC transporter permease n=1 Tax=Streptomyces cylindrosporus TaxID=2927583 RepID=A0ABS9Y489_9ACTN|nr:ABC transporter permease [Streptomyces cylindrosporus]MCI3272018.1 ABC transporter permease [Streptomyces cylindrosporus]